MTDKATEHPKAEEGQTHNMPEWCMVDVNTPQVGWCACNDGGGIWLDYWTGDKWASAPHGAGEVLEFHQVTVTAALKDFKSSFEDFDFEHLLQALDHFTPWGQFEDRE